jgi:lipopolysaccharide export system permease protein
MIITRYLTREVVNAMVAVTGILLLTFLCQQLVRYLNYAAIGKIPTDTEVLLQLISFEVPYLLALLLPLGLYIGIILAYGRLYTDNEMAILHMSGFGPKRVMILSMYISLSIALIVLFLMIWVNPWISVKQRQLRGSDEVTLHLIQTLVPGRFHASPDGSRVMYAETLSRDHERAGSVFTAQEKYNPVNPTQPSWSLVLGQEGYQVREKDTGADFFVITNGYRYEGVPGQSDYKIVQFKKYAVRILQNPVNPLHAEAETLSTSQLWQNYDEPKRAAELQWRLSISLSVVLLGLLGVYFSVVQPRKGRYAMLLPAILVYVVYVNLLYVARHWVEQQTVPISVGMWWVHVLLILFLSMAWLIRQRKTVA